MSRRYLSLWLPDWPLERLRLKARRTGTPFPAEAVPLALVTPVRRAFSRSRSSGQSGSQSER